VLESDCSSQSAFSVLLKRQHNIALGPKSTLQMPVTFTPHEMRAYQARLTVSVKREDGLAWDCIQQNG